MKAYSLILCLGAAVFTFGCDDELLPQAKYRVIHASADAPYVAIKLNNKVAKGLEMVNYQVGSGLKSVIAGNYDLAVEALLPGETRAEVIAANLNFAADMQYDVIALNYVADGIEPVVLSRDDVKPHDDEVRVDILHAHPDIPGVDIYLTTATDISKVSPAISNLEFKVDSSELPVTIPQGSYRIRITLNDNKSVAFDSGELMLVGGSDLLITALPNVDGGAVSPVNLLLADGEGVSVLRSSNENATVRVVHAVDDAPEVDVLASGSPIGGFTNIAFREFRSVDVTPGSYDLQVAAAADNSIVAIDAPGVEFNAGSSTSIYAVGKLNSLVDSTIEPLVIAEDLRSVITNAKVNVVHASPTAGSLGLVDIHASVDGSYSADTAVLKGVDFKGSATLNVAAGTYYLAVILSSDTGYTPAVSAMAAVENGGVYSVVATDDFAGGLVLNVDNTAP